MTMMLGHERCDVCDTRLSPVLGRCPWCEMQRYGRIQFWQTHLPTLAANLAIGAALCRAFKLGLMFCDGMDQNSVRGVFMGREYPWNPGCDKAAP